MLNKNNYLYTIHCISCLKVLGICEKGLRREKIYCLKCAKKELKTCNNGDKNNE